MKKTPAELIIEKFGGVTRAAEALGRNPGSISRWKKKRKDGAPHGSVPVAMHNTILRIAKKRGIKITLTDIILGQAV